MSTIHRSCELLGLRSSLICGTARFSTVRSMEYRTQGNAITASPIQSRRVARGTVSVIVVTFMCLRLSTPGRTDASRIDSCNGFPMHGR